MKEEFPVIQIEDIAFGGKGVGRLAGKVVFVPFTAPGDTIAVELVRQKKSFAEGRMRKLLVPSQHRAEPPEGPVLSVDVTRWSGWSAR